MSIVACAALCVPETRAPAYRLVAARAKRGCNVCRVNCGEGMLVFVLVFLLQNSIKEVVHNAIFNLKTLASVHGALRSILGIIIDPLG